MFYNFAVLKRNLQMKIIGKILYFFYQWLIYLPVLLVLTILTAITTIIFAPVFGDKEITYIPARAWSRLACALAFIKVEIKGAENFDRNTSYIFLANHQSIFDIFVVYGWLKSRFKWIMKIELRKIPFVGAACEAAGHIFIDRSNPIAAKKSIDIAKKKIIDGSSIVVFPEGTRTYDGAVGSFKRGAFKIATDFDLPLVPITISGAFERMHRKTFLITPGKIIMTIHPVIPHSHYETDEEQKAIIAKVRKTIINELQNL